MYAHIISMLLMFFFRYYIHCCLEVTATQTQKSETLITFQRAACVACENDVLPSNPINNATLIACRTWSLEHLSQLCPIGVSLVHLSTAPV